MSLQVDEYTAFQLTPGWDFRTVSGWADGSPRFTGLSKLKPRLEPYLFVAENTKGPEKHRLGEVAFYLDRCGVGVRPTDKLRAQVAIPSDFARPGTAFKWCLYSAGVRCVLQESEMNHLSSSVKKMTLAVALTLPAAPLFAASMSEVVTTRDDQGIHQQYGRDSVYAIQTREPAQTESRMSEGSGGVKGMIAGVGSAGAAVWDKVTGLFEPRSSSAAAPSGPELYGRAGGYVGTDQLALLDRAGPAPAASAPVTTGESLIIGKADNDARYPAAPEAQLYGRGEDRFNGTQTPASGSGSMTTSDSQSRSASDSEYRGNADQLSSTESAGPEGDGMVTGQSESAGASDEPYPAASETPALDQTAVEQSAPSPDAVTVEDQDLNERTDRTADGGARRPADEIGSDQTEIRNN